MVIAIGLCIIGEVNLNVWLLAGIIFDHWIVLAMQLSIIAVGNTSR